VKGGFAEVGPTGLTVLAEQAVPAEEYDPAMIEEAIKDAQEDIADAKSDAERDKGRQRLEQLQTLRTVLQQ
jgi:F-type H+-transporting ATPase subunit epsilon